MLRTVITHCKIVVLLVASLLVGCSGGATHYTEVNSLALGTFAQVTCDATLSPSEITQIIADIDAEAKASMSIFDPESLISRINTNQTDSLDRHIRFNLELAERYYKLSGGKYDVTVKPLTSAWGFAQKQEQAQRPNVDSLLQFVGFDKISFEDNRLIKSDSRVELDLNSIAKGYIVDLVAQSLEQRGVANYMVNIGGEIRCKGLNPHHVEWTIGIETPYEGNFEQDSLEKIVSVTNCAIATSGNYRRFYTTDDGRKVAHTIDPTTGYSVLSELLSVTVLAPTCAEADAAATMFMAMGSEGGALELAQRCESEYGWRYYFIYADGEGYRIEASKSLK